jgi:hypothetical protein
MVATIESRKLKIIDSLVTLDNEDIIKMIEVLLYDEKDFWNTLTEKQRARIEQSIVELDQGSGISHADVLREMRQKYEKP